MLWRILLISFILCRWPTRNWVQFVFKKINKVFCVGIVPICGKLQAFKLGFSICSWLVLLCLDSKQKSICLFLSVYTAFMVISFKYFHSHNMQNRFDFPVFFYFWPYLMTYGNCQSYLQNSLLSSEMVVFLCFCVNKQELFEC